MRISVRHSLGDLRRDCERITLKAPSELRKVVRDSLRDGERLARENARRTARSHGKHYPKSITSEMTGLLRGEYGPDSARPQGGMSFEYGSRNQKPHLDLNRSADEVGFTFALAVRNKASGFFW